jgi:hypothetical protein
MQVTVTQFSGGVTEVLPSDNLVKTANYLKWLCGGFGLEAQDIIDGGGGTAITPVVPYGYMYYSFPYTITVAETGVNTFQNNVLIGGKDVTTMLVNNTPYSVVANDFTFDSVTGTITWLVGVFTTNDTLTINFSRLI